MWSDWLMRQLAKVFHLPVYLKVEGVLRPAASFTLAEVNGKQVVIIEDTI